MTYEETVEHVAALMKPMVEEIEASPPITKNHYGAYMGLIGSFNLDKRRSLVVAEALIKAGANEQGVRDALMVSL